jgi:predicted RNA binding protein YcfA (HicA-like mRNA interferase family)
VSYPKAIRDQLKNISAAKLISALKKDGWKPRRSRGLKQVFTHFSGKIVSIHYHPGKTFTASLLAHLLEDIDWTIADLARLKLIK